MLVKVRVCISCVLCSLQHAQVYTIHKVPYRTCTAHLKWPYRWKKGMVLYMTREKNCHMNLCLFSVEMLEIDPPSLASTVDTRPYIKPGSDYNCPAACGVFSGLQRCLETLLQCRRKTTGRSATGRGESVWQGVKRVMIFFSLPLRSHFDGLLCSATSWASAAKLHYNIWRVCPAGAISPSAIIWNTLNW